MPPKPFSAAARISAAAAVLAAVTLAAYIPVLRAEFIFDDDTLLSENPLMRAPDGIARFWWTRPAVQTPDYWPMTSSTLWLEYRLWGTDRPWGYHLTNVLLHAASCVLVWRVLLRLKVPGAFAAALLLAVHPVCVASVAWVSERKNVLSMFFYATAILLYLRFDDAPRRRWYALSLAAFALALLSKTSVVMLPVVLLGTAWWRRGRVGRRDLAAAAPFFALSAVMGLVTVYFQHKMPMGHEHIQPYTFVQRLAGGGAAVWFYLAKALLPLRLTMVYPRWDLGPASWTFLAGCAGWVGVAVGLALLIRKRRTAWGRAALAAGGYYLLSLLPVLGFVQMRWTVHSLVADHFQYLALVGVAAAAGAAGWTIARRLGPAGRATAGGLAAVLLAALAVLTFAQTRAYRDHLALWQDVVAKNPRSFLAQNNLAITLAARGRRDEAAAAYREALRLNPQAAAVHFNLGSLMSQAKAYGEAEKHFLLAITCRAQYAAAHKDLGISPDYPEALNDLGIVLEKTGRFREAEARYAAAIRAQPDAFDPHNNLGKLLVNLRRPAEGEPLLRTALKLRPDSIVAMFNLAHALDSQGQLERALDLYRRVLEIRPDYVRALNNAAGVLASLGRPAEGIPLLERALRAAPNDSGVHSNLGVTLLRLGRPSEAIPHFLRAVKIDGGNVVAWNNLGLAQARLGRPDQAAESCRRALAIRPGYFEARKNLAVVLDASGRTAEAAREFRLALKLRAKSPEVLGGLARLLATDPKADLRDGAEAVRLAERACELTGSRSYRLVDTLAAAYAEAGRFEDAVKAARRAADQAARDGNGAFAAAARKRLELYKAARPFRRGQQPTTRRSPGT